MVLNLYIDGAAKGNPGQASCAVVVCDSGGTVLFKKATLIGIATNNVAEYCGLIFGLSECLRYKAEEIVVYSDSLLLVKQLNGEYKTKDEWLRRLKLIAVSLISHFRKVRIVHIPREKNKQADKLANSVFGSNDGLFKTV